MATQTQLIKTINQLLRARDRHAFALDLVPVDSAAYWYHMDEFYRLHNEYAFQLSRLITVYRLSAAVIRNQAA